MEEEEEGGGEVMVIIRPPSQFKLESTNPRLTPPRLEQGGSFTQGPTPQQDSQGQGGQAQLRVRAKVKVKGPTSIKPPPPPHPWEKEDLMPRLLLPWAHHLPSTTIMVQGPSQG